MSFLKNLITQPKIVGAVAPSGQVLAKKMAAEIDFTRDGPVIELGPGTGVVTKTILDAGVKPANLTVVEYSINFCDHLSHQFEKINIIQGNAIQIKETLPNIETGSVASFVSSLPLLYSSIPIRQQLLKEALELLQPGAPYIQFSYGRYSPIPIDTVDIKVKKSNWIFTNIPPARVWVYRKNV